MRDAMSMDVRGDFSITDNVNVEHGLDVEKSGINTAPLIAKKEQNA